MEIAVSCALFSSHPSYYYGIIIVVIIIVCFIMTLNTVIDY